MGKAKHRPSKSQAQKNELSHDSNGPLFFYMPCGSYGELCQWFPSVFIISKAQISSLIGHAPDDGDLVESITFNCAEQFMMYCKAARFRDKDTQERVLAAPFPKEQKKLGKLVAGFADESWDEVKSEVVVAGSIAKFGQDPRLRELLLGTSDRLLVEAARKDRIWGIGYKADEAMAHQDDWGENRLGLALMAAREHLRQDNAKTDS